MNRWLVASGLACCALIFQGCDSSRPAGGDGAVVAIPHERTSQVTADPNRPAQPFQGQTDLEVSQFSREGSSPLKLVEGNPLRGSYSVEQEGDLVRFGVRAGNYAGKSQGRVSLEVCVESDCRTSEAVASDFKDNDFIKFELVPALAVRANQELRFSLDRTESAGTSFAIWSYPSETAAAKVSVPSDGNRSVSLALYRVAE